VQRHGVGRRALQLARVLDQDHPLFEMGHLREKRIGQRGLARAGAAHHEDIAAPADRFGQGSRHRLVHDPVMDIVGEPMNAGGWLADGKARRAGDRGQQTLKPFTRPSPCGSSSAEMIGASACASPRAWLATSRMIRSVWAASHRRPVSMRPRPGGRARAARRD
jgi:hypothetical protein